MNNVVKNIAAAAGLTLLASAAFAQAPAQPPAPVRQGILSRLLHSKPKPSTYQNNSTLNHPMGSRPMNGQMGAHPYGTMGSRPMMGSLPMMGSHPMMGGRPMMGSHSMMGGQIIGNKNSRVFHMPGDRGSMPAPQNRVYFSSVAAAQAAGYHAAGGRHSMTGGHMMRPGMMQH